MAKSRRIPAYVHHKPTGQARVRINGKDHYLGKYGSPESHDRYDELIAELVIDSEPASTKTLTAVLAAWWPECKRRYHKGKGKLGGAQNWRSVIRLLRTHCGDHRAEDLGPVKLRKVLEQAAEESGRKRGRESFPEKTPDPFSSPDPFTRDADNQVVEGPTPGEQLQCLQRFGALVRRAGDVLTEHRKALRLPPWLPAKPDWDTLWDGRWELALSAVLQEERAVTSPCGHRLIVSDDVFLDSAIMLQRLAARPNPVLRHDGTRQRDNRTARTVVSVDPSTNRVTIDGYAKDWPIEPRETAILAALVQAKENGNQYV